MLRIIVSAPIEVISQILPLADELLNLLSSRIQDILFHRRYHFQIPETNLVKFVVPRENAKPMKPKIKPRNTFSIFSQHSKVAGYRCLGAMPSFSQHTCNS